MVMRRVIRGNFENLTEDSERTSLKRSNDQPQAFSEKKSCVEFDSAVVGSISDQFSISSQLIVDQSSLASAMLAEDFVPNENGIRRGVSIPSRWPAPQFTMMSSSQPRESRRFVCQMCSATLSNQYALNRHIQTAHQDGRSRLTFSCEMCDDKFLRKDTLQRHIRCHQRIGYHDCEGCDRSFRKDTLKEHLQAAKNQRCRQLYERSKAPNLISNMRPFDGPDMEPVDSVNTASSSSSDEIFAVQSTVEDYIFVTDYFTLAEEMSKEDSGLQEGGDIMIATLSTETEKPHVHEVSTCTSIPEETSIELSQLIHQVANESPWNALHYTLNVPLPRTTPLRVPAMMADEHTTTQAILHNALEPDLLSTEDKSMLMQLSGKPMMPESFKVDTCDALERRAFAATLPLTSVEKQVRSACSRTRTASGSLWICKLCSYWSGDPNSIEKHAGGHVKCQLEPRYECPKCDIVFVFESDRDLHMCASLEEDISAGTCMIKECESSRFMETEEEDWVGPALRQKIIEDLRVWEHWQHLENLLSAHRFIKHCRSLRASNARSVQTDPPPRSQQVWPQARYTAHSSNGATDLYDPCALMEKLSVDDPDLIFGRSLESESHSVPSLRLEASS